MYRDEIKFWVALRIFVDAYIDEIFRLDRTESHNPVVHIQGLRVLQRLLGAEASKAEERKMQADFQNELKKTGKSGTEARRNKQ